ncbi:MAG TPA: hypothetical protein PLD25_30515 [Chloroflexota bacterium]|nr:hypothetical protein [Chloroflexota bacterium]HUM68021.1 hypothetical protein [Chloroflexota bacterium]
MSKRKEIPDVMSQLQGLGTAAPPPADTPTPSLPIPKTTPPRGEQPITRLNKNRTPKSRLVGRATYDIGSELKQVIERESVDLGVPASQLAKYLLLYAWDFYVRGEIPPPALERSTSPKFRNTIEFDD